MACALESVRPVADRHSHAPRILIIAMGCAIASDGQAIVSTIISLNVVYIAAIGLLFVLHETGRQVAPRCAPLMMLSGAATSLTVTAARCAGVSCMPVWLPLPAGLAASACVLAAWHVELFRRRARS
jgi:SSS family solute:Na+ symporter